MCRTKRPMTSLRTGAPLRLRLPRPAANRAPRLARWCALPGSTGQLNKQSCAAAKTPTRVQDYGIAGMVRSAAWLDCSVGVEVLSIGRSATGREDCAMELAGSQLLMRISLQGGWVWVSVGSLDEGGAPEPLFNVGDTPEGWTTVRKFVQALERSGVRSLQPRPLQIGEGADGWVIGSIAGSSRLSGITDLRNPTRSPWGQSWQPRILHRPILRRRTQSRSTLNRKPTLNPCLSRISPSRSVSTRSSRRIPRSRIFGPRSNDCGRNSNPAHRRNLRLLPPIHPPQRRTTFRRRTPSISRTLVKSSSFPDPKLITRRSSSRKCGSTTNSWPSLTPRFDGGSKPFSLAALLHAVPSHSSPKRPHESHQTQPASGG
jgi:hypothetical protein